MSAGSWPLDCGAHRALRRREGVDASEQVDPEEWHKIMDRFFAILSEGVYHFEGTIDQYTGDAIKALFGAPIAHEDHARRASYAALKLRELAYPGLYANAA